MATAATRSMDGCAVSVSVDRTLYFRMHDHGSRLVMTTFFLIRHAQADAPAETILGRAPGFGLSSEGRAQAENLVLWIATAPLEFVYSSPMERAHETAEILALHFGLSVTTEESFNELDYAGWTGMSYKALRRDPAWQAFNAHRSVSRIPGGESMLEVQARALAAMDRLVAHHANGTIALVTHADVIRAILAYFSGIPIDFALRFDIDHASITIVRLDEAGPRIVLVNGPGPHLPA